MQSAQQSQAAAGRQADSAAHEGYAEGEGARQHAARALDLACERAHAVPRVEAPEHDVEEVDPVDVRDGLRLQPVGGPHVGDGYEREHQEGRECEHGHDLQGAVRRCGDALRLLPGWRADVQGAMLAAGVAADKVSLMSLHDAPWPLLAHLACAAKRMHSLDRSKWQSNMYSGGAGTQKRACAEWPTMSRPR
jgi:hypothetical protein